MIFQTSYNKPAYNVFVKLLRSPLSFMIQWNYTVINQNKKLNQVFKKKVKGGEIF